jgi:hypothetical protein
MFQRHGRRSTTRGHEKRRAGVEKAKTGMFFLFCCCKTYHAGNSIGPEDGGHIHKGSWYVETIGNCPYLVQRSKAYVRAYTEKVVFWHKKTG